LAGASRRRARPHCDALAADRAAGRSIGRR
jgi:hypothetical protein